MPGARSSKPPVDLPGWIKRHARQLPLRHKLAFAVDHHPVAVPAQTRGRQLGLVQSDPCTGFDRMDPELVDSGVNIG